MAKTAEQQTGPLSKRRQLLWLAAIWLASVLSLGLVAGLLRLLLHAAGLRSH
ncbi:DUF2474 family protein [Pseudomonas sp. NFXW11]|uniref:DUF2474 family protein n=1 Tax=Pseudomonas sp. NFXW11 TaxID=2819531 RepID=UPI003CFA19A0